VQGGVVVQSVGSPPEFFERWINQKIIRTVGSAVLVVLYYQQFHASMEMTFAVAVVALVTYQLLIWLPLRRNLTFQAIIVVFLCALALYIHFHGQPAVNLLLWPMVVILAATPSYRTIPSLVFGIITMATVVVVSYDATFPWGTLFGVAGTYALVRGRRLRREAAELREQHLEELGAAHEELKRAHAELELSSVESVRYAALSERSRIAKDIHDVIGHNLTTLIVQLQALQYMLPHDPAVAATRVPAMLEVARSGLKDVRKVVVDLAEDETGLGIAALRGLVSQVEGQSGLQIDFYASIDDGDWPLQHSIILYRVLQESLTNILRYSQAETVSVHVEANHEDISLRVADDGVYTGDPPIEPGFGMRNMVERCAAVGGGCRWSVNLPHGLKVMATLPCTEVSQET
jgi:signal transduction histidine kinase